MAKYTRGLHRRYPDINRLTPTDLFIKSRDQKRLVAQWVSDSQVSSRFSSIDCETPYPIPECEGHFCFGSLSRQSENDSLRKEKDLYDKVRFISKEFEKNLKSQTKNEKKRLRQKRKRHDKNLNLLRRTDGYISSITPMTNLPTLFEIEYTRIITYWQSLEPNIKIDNDYEPLPVASVLTLRPSECLETRTIMCILKSIEKKALEHSYGVKYNEEIRLLRIFDFNIMGTIDNKCYQVIVMS